MKKNLNFAVAFFLFGVLAILPGCVSSPIAIAPSTTPVSANDLVTEIGPASGSATAVYLLFLRLPGSGGQLLQPAIDSALKKTAADALIDVKVEQHNFYFLLFSIRRTEVYGTAVKIQKGGTIK